MTDTSDLSALAVVPARGGSKRIKEKALRILDGSPLIHHTLGTANKAGVFDQILVTSDDDRILRTAAQVDDVDLRERPPELGEDDVTLDAVIYDAVEHAEAQAGGSYDTVVTLQPTSPALTAETLRDAFEDFQQRDVDASLAVVEESVLSWSIEDGQPVPSYEARRNRQWLPDRYDETGAFVFTRRDALTPESRLGESIRLYPIPKAESVDVDDETDWLYAQALVDRRRIAFVTKGNEEVGFGHVYRTLTLADRYLGHEICFICPETSKEALQLVRDLGYEVRTPEDSQVVPREIEAFEPDIVINDLLDTSRDYIESLTGSDGFVVNFEDLGEGADHAHLVFNALYERSQPPEHHRFGADYVCLNRGFLLSDPAPFREDPGTLVLTFGGADENNLTTKTLRAVEPLVQDGALDRIHAILGPGFAHDKSLDGFLDSTSGALNQALRIHREVEDMPGLMREADLAVTSNGRTVYELGAMGVPGISMSQNDRETLHLFSRYSEGFVYLGLGPNVEHRELGATIRDLLENPERRQRMREVLLDADLRGGVDRVKREIDNEYERFRHDQPYNR